VQAARANSRPTANESPMVLATAKVQ